MAKQVVLTRKHKEALVDVYRCKLTAKDMDKIAYSELSRVGYLQDGLLTKEGVMKAQELIDKAPVDSGFTVAGALVTCVIMSSMFIMVMTASSAFADCTVQNDTDHTFTVSSGNTTNQTVGSHTTTTIASGVITGQSNDGIEIGGYCKTGDRMKIKKVRGMPVLLPK